MLCVLAGPLLAEGALRLLLFSESEVFAGAGASLRQPGLFANATEDSEYWKLQHVFTAPEDRRIPVHYSPDVGWIGSKVRRNRHFHASERTDDRRPVVLYGSSYASCKTPEDLCFETLLDETEAGATHELVNLGVPGYGIDQAYLLMKTSVGDYVALDPVVVVSFMVESDLDRAALSFRQRPKPLLEWKDGVLLEPRPVTEDIDEFLRAEPIGITSYAWNYLLYGTEVFPVGLRRTLTGTAEKRRKKRQLCRAILLATAEELEAHGLDYFFLLFHEESAWQPRDSPCWKDSFAHKILDQEGIPYVDGRTDMEAWAAEHGVAISELFIPDGVGVGHLNEEGNRAVTATLARGLAGSFDNADASRIRDRLQVTLLDSSNPD